MQGCASDFKVENPRRSKQNPILTSPTRQRAIRRRRRHRHRGAAGVKLRGSHSLEPSIRRSLAASVPWPSARPHGRRACPRRDTNRVRPRVSTAAAAAASGEGGGNRTRAIWPQGSLQTCSSWAAPSWAGRWSRPIANANSSGAAQEVVNGIRKVSKTMTEQEARQILGISEKTSWEEILKRYDTMFEKNGKSGSFYLQSKVHGAKECLEPIYHEKPDITN